MTGTTLSPFIRLTPTGITTISGTTQVYRLTVTRTPYSTGIGAGATPNQIAVANGFQGLVTGATGDAASLVAGVDAMAASDALMFFDQASPEPYGAYARSLLNTGELFSRQVHLQTHETPNMLQGFDIWMRGYGLWGSGDDQDYRFGSDIDTWGGAVGVTYRSGPFYVGAAGGISQDDVDYNLGNSGGENKSWQAGIYAGYEFGGGFDADLQINYNHANISAVRTVNVGSINRSAEADTNGHQWRIVSTVGYNFDISGLTARPFAGFDYASGNVDAFTETGAGAASLSVADFEADRADLLLGFDLRSNPNAKISPYGRLMWRHNLDTRTTW